MISTILMICLAVVIVMIVATLILSEPLPDETPYAAIFARNESGNFTSYFGGDGMIGDALAGVRFDHPRAVGRASPRPQHDPEALSGTR